MTDMKRRAFLGGAAAAMALGGALPRARAGGAGAGKNLLVLQVGGGWDTAYALDPKPGSATVDSPAGTLQEFGGLPIFVDDSRPNVTAYFERHAAVTAVVKGIHIRSIVHPDCMRRLLTGATVGASPDIGAIVGSELAPDLPAPYLALSSQVFPGYLASATVSMGRTKQLVGILDPQKAPPLVGGEPLFVPDADDEDAIRRYTTARLERERAVRGARGYNKARLDDFARALESGDLLKESSDAFGDRGLALTLDQQLALAIDSLQSDLCRAVTVSDDFTMWDTHANNALQGPFQDGLFTSLTALVDDLSDRPGRSAGSSMLDETVVVVVSELTRTPLLNADGGKDHWPYGTVMVIGGGVDGGRVLGATDDQQVGTTIDLATGESDRGGKLLVYDNFAAGILELLDVDPEPYLPGVTPLRGL